MLKQPLQWALRIGLTAAILAGTFLAGRWHARSQSVLDSADSSELQRAMGYYRWSITIPDDFDGGTISLTCQAGDRTWSSGETGGFKAGQAIVIYARRDIVSKKIEYAFLSPNSIGRGTIEDPFAHASFLTNRTVPECRTGDWLLAGANAGGGGVKTKPTGETKAELMVSVALQKKSQVE